MLDSPTIDGLRALRLDAMAAALAEQREQASYTGLGFEERLGLLVDRELTARSNRKLERHLKTARLRVPATVEDIDFRHPRGLDKAQILTLAQAHWAGHHRAVVITGPTGSGCGPALKMPMIRALGMPMIGNHNAPPAGVAGRCGRCGVAGGRQGAGVSR